MEEAVNAGERAREHASLILCSLFAALFFSPLLWGPFLDDATSGRRQAVRERPSVASVFQHIVAVSSDSVVSWNIFLGFWRESE